MQGVPLASCNMSARDAALSAIRRHFVDEFIAGGHVRRLVAE